ncbi:MAG: peptidase U32 family protein [Halobacteriota archaeon]
MKKVELLSPVGGCKSLKPAVEHGADAVYFGVGKKFNARRRAANFSIEELRNAVLYAHDNGVKVYITFNILIKNHELREFFDNISDAYSKGIDGIIIQHLSFARLLKDTFPDLRIHISTQTGITNTYYSDLLYGVDRVTLPREFSLVEVRDFVEKTGIDTEVFVHGALCFCYGGQCLFSSFLGGRSGNRGICAQPCRKRYNHSYLLSTEDLCLAGRIPAIIESGVSALKIEGRLRSPRYTALATRVYRLSVDSYYNGNFCLPERELKDLALEFNREFTEGCMFGASDIVASDSPKNRGVPLGMIAEDTTLTLCEPLSVGDGIGIWTKSGIDGAVIKEIERDGKSVTSADAGDTIKLFIRAEEGDRIYKTSSRNNTHYAHVKPKPGLNTPSRSKPLVVMPPIENTGHSSREILAKVYSRADAKGALKAGANSVFYSIFAPDFHESGAQPYIPRILSDHEAKEAIHKLKTTDAVLLGNFGLLAVLSRSNTRTIYLDYSANVFNDLDMAFIKGAVPIVSPELNLTELLAFKNKQFAVLVHGRPVLMTSKYPLKESSLKDDLGFVFPVRQEHKYTQILNSLPIGFFNDIKKLRGITKFFFDLTDGDAERIIRMYKDVLNSKTVKKSVRRKHTRGHFNRGVS